MKKKVDTTKVTCSLCNNQVTKSAVEFYNHICYHFQTVGDITDSASNTIKCPFCKSINVRQSEDEFYDHFYENYPNKCTLLK